MKKIIWLLIFLSPVAYASDGITVNGSPSGILINGTSLTQAQSSGSQNGYLASADWTTFNGKQAAGNYLTALTGDGSASGPGSAAFTLSTVNSSPGTFGSAANACTLTVNGKGLVTSASQAAIQIAESQVTNLVSDLAGKQPTGSYITALTSDVAASGPGSAAATIQPNVVTNSKLAQMAADTVKANTTGLTANASDDTLGTMTESASSVLILTGWSDATIGSPTIQIKQSSGSLSGYLSSTDWTTFNQKQPAGNYITALTGDGTASGPGSATFTLATVNTNTGSFGSSTAIPSFTVNGKGLITAASTNAVVAPAGTLSGTTLNSTVVSSSLTSVGTIATGVWNGTVTAGFQVLTSGTTYTTPAGITTATLFKFVLIGAGGGGGYSNVGANTGSGGGGGAGTLLFITGLSPSTGYTIAVGSAGAGGIQSSATAATPGGDTQITIGVTTYTSNGGGAGGINAVNGGAGGTSSASLGSGFTGQAGSSGTTGSSGGGQGGNSGLGYGTGGGGIIIAGTGISGTGFGGGGGGGHGATGNGGAGAQGGIIVEWKN